MILRVRCYKNLQQNFKEFAKSKAPTEINKKKPPLLFYNKPLLFHNKPLLFHSEKTILIQAHTIIQKV